MQTQRRESEGWCLVEDEFEGQVNEEAPKQLMGNVVTVKVQTKQVMSMDARSTRKNVCLGQKLTASCGKTAFQSP